MLLGSGTTLQSIIDAIDSKALNAKICLVVSDNPNAYALERACLHNIDTYVINSKGIENIDAELFDVLKNYDIDLIVCAGFLKMIGKRLLNKYRIINTHPSLLPKFGGLGMYGMRVHRAVWESKEEFTGPTIHFLNEEYDKGSIIVQTKVEVKPTDTPEVISAKVQAIEKIQLVETLKRFVSRGTLIIICINVLNFAFMNISN